MKSRKEMNIQEIYTCCLFQNVISNVLSNSKEILKMLVTMSGYLTNTISSCQEFVASNNLRLSSISATGSKKDVKKLMNPLYISWITFIID